MSNYCKVSGNIKRHLLGGVATWQREWKPYHHHQSDLKESLPLAGPVRAPVRGAVAGAAPLRCTQCPRLACPPQRRLDRKTHGGAHTKSHKEGGRDREGEKRETVDVIFIIRTQRPASMSVLCPLTARNRWGSAPRFVLRLPVAELRRSDLCERSRNTVALFAVIFAYTVSERERERERERETIGVIALIFQH